MPKNLSEQLLHELGSSIVQGERKPGELLPKVETLSEMKGVSRTVVRETMKGLSARRLIESSTRTGTVVRDREAWLWWDPDIISWAAAAEENQSFLMQLTEVRLAMEPAAVKLAAKNADEEDIATIRHRFDLLEQSVDNEDDWVEADAAFHEAILHASHNELMQSLIQTLQEGLYQSRHTTMRMLQRAGDNSRKMALDLHRDVMTAVIEGKEDEAMARMETLLHTVSHLLKEYEAEVKKEAPN
ncbi:FadR/GntR family transcriptional regulator [Alkalicoccus luteus]|uniref:FadR family transcriptional regulator n=1 Tax=Alkalicoccus luteus TaxID=1237094 RepID=A0A969TWE4_9BACI|nr:FadR/GntR family transcriptional regulator [Alkalicoccus luteus]NJP39127.1 FadR family transcriptional regulator [Alkalicoccus luteus]